MKAKYRKWDWYIKIKGELGFLVFRQLNYSLRQWCQGRNKVRLIERLDKRVLHLLKKGFLKPDDEAINTFIFNVIKNMPETDKEKEEAKRSAEALKSLFNWKSEE